jgi:signal transduction histidine kinase
VRSLLVRLLGHVRTEEALANYARRHNVSWEKSATADAELVTYAEKLLAGAIGSASARVMVASVVKEEPLGIDEVMDILDETRQVIAYSRELEKATAELKSANERLQELDRIKNEFISTVTHELRTPLTAVRSISEILHANPQLPEGQHRHMTGIIIKESERLTRLINQILDFQRLETGKMAWRMQPVDLREICQEALTAVRPLIDDKHIDLSLDLPQHATRVRGDRDRLVQVVLNLLSNAVKFCDSPGGKIALQLEIHPYHLQVEVTDNGPGIHPEDLKIIFEEFRQAKHVSRGRPSGSGLGLAIARRIVEHHGGQIWAASEPGHGSTFAFTLPFTFQQQEE